MSLHVFYGMANDVVLLIFKLHCRQPDRIPEYNVERNAAINVHLVNHPQANNAVSNHRWEDHGELLLTLSSVFAYAAWVRKVFVVVPFGGFKV
jgi:hypothetical protein